MKPEDRSILSTFTALVAVAGFLLAAVGIAAGDGGSGPVEAGAAPVTVTLTEFAVEPAAIAVPAGGSIVVTNAGSMAHNLSVQGTDVRTQDLGPGASVPLDLSALEPGDYEVLCTIAGHGEAGMTATLTVGGTGEVAAGHEGHAAAGGEEEHDWAAMDAAMLETISSFPAATEGTGNEVLAPTVLADGTKQFELTAAVTPWEVEPGRVVDAWTYNGTVPGPMIHVDVGDRVRVVFHNDLPVMSDVHFHGIDVENGMDGVAPITQDPVLPGETFTYELTPDEPAVAMYHAHAHGEMAVPNGLFAVFLVGDLPLPLPEGATVAQEIPMVLNDAGVVGLSLNGKSFPATAPVVAGRGDWLLVHYFNEGLQAHPMHLHQFEQLVVAKDGFPLDSPYYADTVLVGPGERYSVLVHLDQPGTWVWHCHILNHVEAEAGMFGMVTAIVVE
jgi:manganese oxidase